MLMHSQLSVILIGGIGASTRLVGIGTGAGDGLTTVADIMVHSAIGMDGMVVIGDIIITMIGMADPIGVGAEVADGVEILTLTAVL